MLAPDARVPDPQIAALGPIARAGEADRSMGVLSELLKQRAVGDNPKVTTTYKDARDESGENRIFALSHDARGKHLGSQDTGLRSAGSKSSLDAAITAFQSNPTPENLQRLNALAGFVPIAPGGAVAPKAGLAGMTAPGQMSGTGPSQSPFVVSRDALPSGAEREDMAKLDSAKTQLEAVVQALKAGNLNTVLGGVAKNPSGAFGRLSEEYLGFGMDDEQRRTLGTMAMQLQQVKHALIGATRTRPELADVAAAIPDEKSFLRGDTAEQMLPKLEALLISLKSERYSRENIMGSTGVAVPARPPVAPAPPRPPAAPAPPQPAQHPEGRRLYSPSQKRWYVIRGGQPVPE
jgi:uncharacterized protein YbaR (Trm112 family)